MFSQRVCRFQICSMVLLPFQNPACSFTIISSLLWPQSVQNDFQQNFACMADRMVVLAWLEIAFLRSVMVSDWVHEVGHLPVCQILLQKMVSMSITAFCPCFKRLVGMLSIPAACPHFRVLTTVDSSCSWGTLESSLFCKFIVNFIYLLL